MAETHSTKLHYGKILALSLVMGILIYLIDFSLETLLVSESMDQVLVQTVVITVVAPILGGIFLIQWRRKNLGWAIIGGAILILLFRLGAFLLFSAL